MEVKCQKCSRIYDSKLGMCPYCGCTDKEYTETPISKIRISKLIAWIKIIIPVAAVMFMIVYALLYNRVISIDSGFHILRVLGTGTCGENVEWKLDSDGVLIISGKGEMYNYTLLEKSSIPEYFYAGAIKDVRIKNGVTSIGNRAFYSCSDLVSVSLPDSLTSIGSEAFSSCKNLESITIPDNVSSIGEKAFKDCKSLVSITIPKGVTCIEDGTFWNCENFTSITIPNSVVSIGEYAFDDCENLTSVKIPNSVVSIGDTAFCSCEGLTSINIPDSVTTIGGQAFTLCTGLTSITVPKSVVSMGWNAFSGWTTSQTIYIEGYSETPSGWDSRWSGSCDATIVWEQ